MARRGYAGGNRLLDALPAHELASLRPLLTNVGLRVRAKLYEPDETIERVYFPIDSIVSTVATMTDGHEIEISTIGHEGMVGLEVVLDSERSSSRAMCQMAGESAFMDVAAIKSQLPSHPVFLRLLLRYTQAVINDLAQRVACNRLHPVSERCGRWLLMVQDRTGGDAFPLTQEFLAMMLGVRRAAVAVAAAGLQNAGFISYARGRVTIRDRSGLESASCECYGVITREFDRVFSVVRV